MCGKSLNILDILELSMAVEYTGWLPRPDGQTAAVPILKQCGCINSPQRQCRNKALTRCRDRDLFDISRENPDARPRHYLDYKQYLYSAT